MVGSLRGNAGATAAGRGIGGVAGAMPEPGRSESRSHSWTGPARESEGGRAWPPPDVCRRDGGGDRHDLGVVWTAPWRVDVTRSVKPVGNTLEIDVVNLWPNRLIGDAALPPEKRRTKTNVQKFYRGKHAPLPSGLLGPVTLHLTTP